MENNFATAKALTKIEAFQDLPLTPLTPSDNIDAKAFTAWLIPMLRNVNEVTNGR